MADHLVDGPPNPKRQKLDPFQGPSDSSDVLDMFDLENNLPDELMSSSSWGLSDSVSNSKPPAQGPGPGSLQNGVENADNSNIRQIQINHMLSQGSKNLVSSTLALAGQLGNKSPSLQSPPNVAVTKPSVDQLNLGNLPSSIPNSTSLPSMANNGSSPQVISSLQGLNNSVASSMIVTNSSMNTVSNMAGGGLVVSSSVNKPMQSTTNLLSSGQPLHQGNLSVPQTLQNGPILNRMTMHLNTRAVAPHVVHPLGSRLQSPNLQMTLGGNVNQGVGPNTPYNYPNSNQQGVPTATATGIVSSHVGKLNIPQARFGGPSAPLSNVTSETGTNQAHSLAISPVQAQASVSSTSQPTQQPAQNHSAPPAPSTDPEKRKLIQQQLVLLLHAHKCQRRESQLNGEVLPCNLPHCKTMKNVLNHMTTCQAGKSCAVAHCSSSRQIISHWKHCVRNDCPVCLPLKQADKNRNSNNVSVATSTSQSTQSPNPSASDMRRAYDALGIQCPATGANVMPNNLLSSPVQPKTGLRLPLTSGSSISSLAGNISGVRVLTPSQVQSTANMSLPLGSDSTPISIANSVASTPSNTPQNVNVMFGLSDSGNQGLITQLPAGLQSGQVTANPVQVTKEWHQSVTPDLRNHLVHKLVQAIFPTPDPQAMLDRRMHNLVAYARKVEGDMYEMANSRSEYYHLLAEKIYKIQKELEEKRQKRKEQQLQQQTVQPQNQIRPVMQTSTPVNIRQASAPTSIPQQQGLRSSSPALSANMSGISALNQTSSRLVFPVQTNPAQNNQQTIAIPGPSPNASGNTVLSPFGQTLSQSSNIPTTIPTQFPVTCNNAANLTQTSPCNNAQTGQFNDGLKSRLAPSPTNFGTLQQQTNVTQAVSTNISSTRIQTPTSSSDTITPLASVGGPKSINSSRGPSPAPASPLQPSPSLSSNLGKGMSAAERMNLSTSRQNSMSSQMAAITAAHERDEESPPPSSENVKGKQDQIKTDDMSIKTEDEAECGGHNEGGKNIKNDISPDIKKEIKIESVDEDSNLSSIKNEISSIKEENRADKSSTDIKPIPSEVDLESNISVDKKPKKCIFKPDELRQKLMPTLEKLYRQDPESHPFRQPVDPQTLGIPDYFDIVKRPMDLSTIKRKLDLGQYSDPWEYVDDVWLMFDNAWLYNRKTSKVYRYCTKLAEVFEQEIDPVMQSMGYCCGRKYTFNPQVLCCYGKQLCTIPRDAKYYSYQNSLKAYGLGSDRYTFCQKCFNDIPGDTVTLGDDPSQAQTAIKKDQFKEMKNDHLEMEAFVYCTDCSRKLHQICVLHNENIWPQGFTCDECLKKRGQKRKENKFNAKRLPVTNLSVYIENRVNVFLKKKEAGAGEVHIRVVSSSEKVVEVKPGMRNKYVETGEMAGEFPYRAKALFAFEEIDGVDVCFFGMHVQEYGSECPPPNTRRVYIAYLDSVHFFKPRQFRTAVYHEILLGYMDYVKKLGYTMAHIWACPPSEGDDYIFHCHPAEQKIPKPKRLQDWYKKMLDKGIIERIVFDYKDILKQAMEDNLRSAADLPYFEGDFWPNVLEESIKELDQEEEEKRKRAEAAEAAANAQILSLSEETETGQDGKKKGQKKAKKSNKSKANQRKNSKKSNMPQTGNDLSAKIFATMEKHKEVFFVIRLHSVQTAASLRPIHDPDPFINCDLMDGRDAFLTLAREKHYEFSSLRRAMFSTMSMLYELHNQGQDKFVYTCNNCKGHVETRYHCTICDDFDLCIQCYEKEGHPHKMEKLGLDLDDGSSPSDTKVNPNDARKLSIQRCIQSLVHACQCRDANCRLTSCLKMKRVVTHTKVCKRKTNGGCPICKQLIALCCYHAKHCQETKCPVPFCSNIKHKLKQQQLQQRLQQAQLLRRRMAVMNTRTAPQGTTLPGANNVPLGTAMHPSGLPAGINPTNSLSPGVQSSINMQPTHQPGIGLKPGTQTPPANVLQVVKQVQEEAARQQAPHVNYGKLNPNGVPGQNMPPPTFQRTLPHLGANQGGNLLPMEQWQPRYGSGTAPSMRQPSPQLMQTQGSLNQTSLPTSQQTLRPNSSALNSSGSVMQKQALQQLMQMLKSPQSAEQQQQILSILKSNPQLMAACIKQRQQAQMQQSGGVGVGGAPQQQQQQQQQQPQQPQQQFQHILGQASNPSQHSTRMPVQGGILTQPPQALGQGPSNQAMVQHQQWFKQQQLIALQRQQQQQFQQPNAPPSYQQRLPAIRQPHISYNSSFTEQQFSPIQNIKPTPPPVPSPQGVMGPPQGSLSVQQQQIMQSVRSPPPIRSPQPSPSSRPLPSPRNQTIPSPRGPQPSPHDHSSSEMLLGQSHSGPNQDNNEVPPMTPQDQLSKFVEQL